LLGTAHYDAAVALSDINKASTVLTLLLASIATVGTGLFTLAVLTSNWMEPACDWPTPRNADYCSISADDYSGAAPYAAAFLLLFLLTAWLYRRARAPRGRASASNRTAPKQARKVIAVGVLTALAAIATVVLPNLV
jgi:hypothetical protein